MGTFELVLFLIVAVLLSALLSQLSKRISTPLVQIVLGVVIALFVNLPVEISLDPELFLVLFIAPLLFNEAKNVDRLGFWQNKQMILSLALGLVIATTFAVGFAVHSLMPAIPFAAALALGAALGPTDAVAVSSMSSVARLSDKQKSILGGESLINDASGLVAFQFAIAAALTGEFSLADAGRVFVLEFFGGIALGAVVGWLCSVFIEFVRERGLENRTFHVLFDLALPFSAYMLGSSLHVSGVLTVVACGIAFSLSRNQAGSEIAKMNIVSSGVWETIAFALNGIVFVLLGMMLPSGMVDNLGDGVSMIDFALLGVSFAVAVIVIACRFAWVLLMERVFGSADEIDRGLLRHAAVISCAGAKGAITLSIAMTIPFAVAARSSMIFIASIAIVVTLLVANFAVPVLAPAGEVGDSERRKAEYKAFRRSLQSVVGKLSDEMREADGYEVMAYQSVIGEYNTRISNLDADQGVDSGEGLAMLRREALHWQEQKAREMMAAGIVSNEAGDKMIASLARRGERLRKQGGSFSSIDSFARNLRSAWRSMLKSIGLQSVPRNEEDEEMKVLKVECKSYALGKLAALNEDDGYRAEDVSAVLIEYQRSLRDARATAPSVTQVIKSSGQADEIRMRAFRYEMELLGEEYSDGRLDRKSLNKLRRQVSAMQLDVADEI